MVKPILIIDNSPSNPTQINGLLYYLKKITNAKTIIIQGDQDFSVINRNLYSFCIVSGGSFFYDYNLITSQINFLRNTYLPTLGICFGMQIIVHAFGGTGRDKKLTLKRYGWQQIKITNKYHHHFLFKDVDSKFFAYESHQFVTGNFSKQISLLASSIDGPEIIKIKYKNIFGVQFHPELSNKSIDKNATLILENFIEKFK